MRVYISSDHAGFELKRHLCEHLDGLTYDVVDRGPADFDPDDDYPPLSFALATAVRDDPGSLGVMIGGSGNGEQISANKVSGIRAALAWSEETARLAREHNDAQVVAVGARMHTAAEAAAIVMSFLTTSFSAEDRHNRRIELISNHESSGRRADSPAAPTAPRTAR